MHQLGLDQHAWHHIDSNNTTLQIVRYWHQEELTVLREDRELFRGIFIER